MRKKQRITPLTAEEAQALSHRIDKIADNFHGQFDELEAALGMLVVGRLVGWKLLVLIHNKRTIRKYEDILGIQIRQEFPEEGPLTAKSKAYELIRDLGNYWKAVSGEVKVDDRRELQKS